MAPATDAPQAASAQAAAPHAAAVPLPIPTSVTTAAADAMAALQEPQVQPLAQLQPLAQPLVQPAADAVDVDEGFEDDDFPEEFPFWYGSSSGERTFDHAADLLPGGRPSSLSSSAASASWAWAKPPSNVAASAAASQQQQHNSDQFNQQHQQQHQHQHQLSTSQRAFFPLDSFMSRRLSVDMRVHDPSGRRASFHDHDSVLHYFVATSQSEQLLDQYISGIIKAFLDEPAPIYATAVAQSPSALSRFSGIDIPDGSNGPSHGDLAAYLNHLKLNVIDKATRTASPKMIGHMTTALPFFHRPLARLLAALNQNVVKIETASTFTNLERQTLAMLHKAFFALPEPFYDQYAYAQDVALGVVASGGTIANITAMWIARNKALSVNPDIDCRGVDKEGFVSAMAKYGFKRAVIIGSTLMHYSFKKAVDLLGLGEEGLVLIPTDAAFRMRADLLKTKVDELVAQNVLIIAIVGIAGTTEAGSIDPLSDIASVAAKHAIHFHVDAAWGGPLIFAPEHRSKLAGIALADSVTIDGHKQLYTPMGLGLLLIRTPSLITYIRKTANYVIRNDSPDLGKFTLEGSRPANALYLHASLNLLGKDGLATLVTRSTTIVRQLSVRLALHPSKAFEVLHEPMSNLLLYRILPSRLRDAVANGTHVPTDADEDEISELTRRVQIAQAAEAPPVMVSMNMPLTPDLADSQHAHRRSTVAGRGQETNQSSSSPSSLRPPPPPVSRGFVSRTRVMYKGHHVDAFRVVIANPLTAWPDVEAVVAEQLVIGAEIEAVMEREAMRRRIRSMFPVPGRDAWWDESPFDL
ncbi:pyridoxal phosphate-dependent transferase [Entophlyctis helioformis]|nr:pyridoxal phosphate-dependent transferase [Entophlyctis helioformis]